MNFYEEHERHTTAKQKPLVQEITTLLSECLLEAEAASKELHATAESEPYTQRWDEYFVNGLRVWKEHFGNGLWRRAAEPVSQLSRAMDYQPTHLVSNGKKIDALVCSLTLKAGELHEIEWEP